MTTKNEINTLKTLAKRYARANRIAQHEALNMFAAAMDFPHWASLATKAKQGWLPSAEQMEQAEALLNQSHSVTGENESYIESSFSKPFDEPRRTGKIGDQIYQVFESLGDIRMEGDGWRILVGEAQFSQPIVQIEQPHSDDSPVRKSDFLDAALVIVDEEAAKVRAGISSDWPRRSTKPDADGVVLHPLFGGKASSWYCLHCDGKITGAQLAENIWHCPTCGASPIDIFSAPASLDEVGAETKLSERPRVQQRPAPKIEVLDSRPKLTLDEDSISKLLRTALLEDAATPAERLGALIAEIYVDEDGDACIVLDEDLWPEAKEPEEAIAVAELLGAELELSVTCMTFPFAWPGLGHATTSTREYVRLLLEAYQEHGVIRRVSSSD
jgi:hypothetical protein